MISISDLKNLILRNAIVAFPSLILHGLWEYVVCGKYYAFESIQSMNQLMIEATVGDVGIALFIFNLILVVRRKISHKFIGIDYLGVILYGIAAAFYFETRALSIDRWIYSESMPIIKGTQIGWVPVIQLILLLPMGIMIESYVRSKLKYMEKA